MANTINIAETVVNEAYVEIGATSASMTALGLMRNVRIQHEIEEAPLSSPHLRADYDSYTRKRGFTIQNTKEATTDLTSEKFAELLKDFIPPTDVILGIPLEFEYKGKTLKIHGRASYYLRMIDKDIEKLRATYANQLSPPKPLAQDASEKKKAAYLKASDQFHKARQARNDKIYDLIEEILFKILNADWENPEVEREWIAKNILITLGDYIPPADAPLGLPSTWFSEENQEQFPIALRILSAYPLRQNPNHLLKNVLRARMF